ncbi:MAG: SGNH/GDSL hydrolase family protein [Candidatus Eisenbacteria bacterium]|uniref:SGNH/GDSL hydrolase family protein n=1 Tax=Eiseniibacteriota bacterium TaxID=2212470 RepID=A0A956LXI5_UNCEI|nr:SGNH/GDSL hydrolase family protein [Candidatus Eisenbacteria bacterium]
MRTASLRQRPQKVRARSVLQNLTVLAITGLVCLLLGEVGSRIYLKLTSGGGSEPVLSETIGEYDPRLGVRLLPNVAAEFSGPEFQTHFRTNGQRLREEEDHAYLEPPGIKRVLLCGDSFTFGHGVNDSQRYGELLENLLPGAEIINTGVWGTGTDQQYLLYLDEGRKYQADLVILAYYVDNITRNGASMRFISGGRIAHKPRYVLRDGKLVLSNVPVPRPGESTVAEEEERERWNEVAGQQGAVPLPFKSFLREHSTFYKLLHARFSTMLHALLGAHPEPFPQYAPEREEWKVTCALFSAFRDSVVANGSDFLLVIVPARDYVLQPEMADTPHRMVKEFCQKEHIEVLDLLPAFRAVEPRHRADLYYRLDAHWTAAGHELAAETIARYLRDHGW